MCLVRWVCIASWHALVPGHPGVFGGLDQFVHCTQCPRFWPTAHTRKHSRAGAQCLSPTRPQANWRCRWSRLPETVASQLQGRAGQQKSQRRADAAGGPGIMIGARHGAANGAGLHCGPRCDRADLPGGLFDGDLIVKVQAWAQGLQPFRGSEAPDRSNLGTSNPAYRAQLFVPEGQHQRRCDQRRQGHVSAAFAV